jgi:periplasmic protein TonB
MQIYSTRYAALLFVAVLHVLFVCLLTLAPSREVIREATVIMATLISEQPKTEIKPDSLAKPLPVTLPMPVIKSVEVPLPNPVIAQTRDIAPIADATATTSSTQSQSASKAETNAVTSATEAIIPPKFDADYLDNPAPAYPALSRRLGEAGRVILRVFVDPNGLASRIEIFTSSQFDRLDQAAVEAVRRWRFAPALLGDKPVSASVLVPVNFSLRS